MWCELVICFFSLVKNVYTYNIQGNFFFVFFRNKWSLIKDSDQSRNVWKNATLHGEKKIVVLTNQIFDIELTKLFCFPNKFSVFPTNLFVEPTKEFIIASCLTKLFVSWTKTLLRRQKKVCQFYFFHRVNFIISGLKNQVSIQQQRFKLYYWGTIDTSPMMIKLYFIILV